MRSIKELLQIMLDNIDIVKIYNVGLCWVNIKLKTTNIISMTEWVKLNEYLNRNRPKPNNIKHYRISQVNSFHWFKKGAITPRKAWLKDEIKKH